MCKNRYTMLNITEKEILDNPNDAELGAYVRDKYFNSKNAEKVSVDKTSLEYDKCLICGKESPYLVSTHIDLRYGYIRGAGQGCFSPKECGN